MTTPDPNKTPTCLHSHTPPIPPFPLLPPTLFELSRQRRALLVMTGHNKPQFSGRVFFACPLSSHALSLTTFFLHLLFSFERSFFCSHLHLTNDADVAYYFCVNSFCKNLRTGNNEEKECTPQQQQQEAKILPQRFCNDTTRRTTATPTEGFCPHPRSLPLASCLSPPNFLPPPATTHTQPALTAEAREGRVRPFRRDDNSPELRCTR